MNLENVLRLILNSSITKADKNTILSKYSEVQNLINFKTPTKYEFFYLNKSHIHQILYDEEKIIKIQSSNPE